MQELTGVLVLNKPAGCTSHDCIMKVRKLFKMKKVGHTGTLDPDVTGVLPVCLGRATKIAEYITDAGKEYVAEVTLGFATSTEDSSGDVVARKAVERTILRREILDVLASLNGTITQTPPMFSSVKVNGKRLYEYAFKGIEVERPSREVHIDEIELLDETETFIGQEVRFNIRVACSKGTYIRTLAVTIGEMLGYPAHLSRLVRTRVGGYTLDEAYSFEQLTEITNYTSILRPIESGVAHLPHFVISDELVAKVLNGAVLDLGETFPAPTAIVSQQKELLAIYQNHPNKDGLVKPIKIIKI